MSSKWKWDEILQRQQQQFQTLKPASCEITAPTVCILEAASKLQYTIREHRFPQVELSLNKRLLVKEKKKLIVYDVVKMPG